MKKNGFRLQPKNFYKTIALAEKMIEEYLKVMKDILPRPLYHQERTKLMNMCRVTSINAKNLSGFLSQIKQNTEIPTNLNEV